MTFKEKYLLGLCNFDRLYDCIEDWHKKKEDGVGLVSSFFDEAEHALADCDAPSAFRHVSIACGTDIAPIMREFTKKCEDNLKIHT